MVKLLLVGVICMAGCTTVTQTTMKNANGETRYCYLSNDHTIVSVGAAAEYNKCLNDAGTAGFKKVD
jgi:hypothetical protein